MATAKTHRPEDAELFKAYWSDDLKYDPLAFVMFNYPWGKPGPLSAHTGPRKWQRDSMIAIGEHFKANRDAIEMGVAEAARVFKDAVSSGRGPGKSAELGMLANWFMTCWPGATVQVTANTETQMRTKTMPEIRKWFQLGRNSHWWIIEAGKITPARWYKEALEALKIDSGYYYTQSIVWSEANPDAFAGLHNHYGVLLIFDEASGIPRTIWTNSEGFFTEPTINRAWLARSNPRNTVNGFYDCFKPGSGWRTRTIDSRDVEGTDKGVYDAIIARFGINSDEVRIEVKGEFPSQGDRSLFSIDEVYAAQHRDAPPAPDAPLVMAVDVARYGADSTVFGWRRGFSLTVHPWVEFQRLGTAQVAQKIAEYEAMTHPDYIVIDGNGVGGPVIDVLRDVHGIRAVPFHGNGSTVKPQHHVNSRMDAYQNLADNIGAVSLPPGPEIAEELQAITYEFQANTNLKKVADKDKIKETLGRSPDKADVAMMLFARRWPIPSRSRGERPAEEPYDPLRHGLG